MRFYNFILRLVGLKFYIESSCGIYIFMKDVCIKMCNCYVVEFNFVYEVVKGLCCGKRRFGSVGYYLFGRSSGRRRCIKCKVVMF